MDGAAQASQLTPATGRDRMAPQPPGVWVRRLTALIAVALAAAGLAVTVWRPLAPPLPDVATDLDRFSTEVLATVDAYVGPLHVAGVVALLISVGVPAALVLWQPGRRLVGRVAGRRERSPLRAAAVAVLVLGLTSLALLPLDVLRGYVHAGRFGFRRAGALLWARDWLVGNAITWIVAGLAGAVLVVAVARWPSGWHWRLVPVVTALGAAVVLVWPVVVEPLFLPTRPLPDGPLRTRLEQVLQRAGEADADLLVGEASLRTTRVNALVTGLGPTRRVILYDTLLRLPHDQIAAVTAHELAHRAHADIPRGVLLTAAAALPVLLVLRMLLTSRAVRDRVGLRGPADPRAVALAVAVVVGAQVVGQPVGMLVSRRAEAAADHAALELTRDPAALVRLARTFTVANLTDPAPPGWVVALWGSHPTVPGRIRAAVDYAAAHDLPLPDLADVRSQEAAIRHPRIAGDANAAPGAAPPGAPGGRP